MSTKHIPDELDGRLELYRIRSNPPDKELDSLLNEYRKAARYAWPKAEWIVGVGRYALVSQCPAITPESPWPGYANASVTVTLHMTFTLATEARIRIDKHGCCGKCLAREGYSDLVHVIYDLHETYLYPTNLKHVE